MDSTERKKSGDERRATNLKHLLSRSEVIDFIRLPIGGPQDYSNPHLPPHVAKDFWECVICEEHYKDEGDVYCHYLRIAKSTVPNVSSSYSVQALRTADTNERITYSEHKHRSSPEYRYVAVQANSIDIRVVNVLSSTNNFSVCLACLSEFEKELKALAARG